MRSFIASIAVLAAFIGHPALAEEATGQEAMRIDVDQEAKTFIFIVDGEPVALLDQTGLHVRDVVSTGEGVRNRAEEFQSRLAKLEKKD